MLLLLSCLFQYLMALFTGPHSDPADTSHQDDDHCHKATAPRNGLTTLHTPAWTKSKSPSADNATPTSRVQVANEILVGRMKRLQDVQEKVRGRLTILQQAIEQWQANCIVSHISSQPSCASDHSDGSRNVTTARLRNRLEQIVDSNSTTDSSSADELWDGSHGNIRTRRRVLRSNWDRNYAHLRSRWAWLQRQCDLIKSKLPSTKDHVISGDDHVVSNDSDHVINEDQVIHEHCARTEPVRFNRKRSSQLLWQHQMVKKRSASNRWPLDEASSMWLDQSLCSINNSHSYVAQYSTVAKKQRSLSLQLGRRGYYGSSENDRHDVDSPDVFVSYHNDVGHHGNLQDTESPMSCYPPSLRHVNSQNRKKRSSEFDINSFVIPYSIASSVRPEKLEYKEIPTPDWREWPVVGVSQLNGFGVHTEDVSDETFAKRHAHCEQLEQQRFLHMCAVASNKRRGSTRLLSSADSVPSPSSPVASPVVARIPSKPDEDDTTPVVLPWLRRKFPLTQEEEATLVSSITSSPLDTPLDVFSPIESPSNNQWTIVSPMATPLATPPPVASTNHADQKSSIVLRLAKRT